MYISSMLNIIITTNFIIESSMYSYVALFRKCINYVCCSSNNELLLSLIMPSIIAK